MSTSTPTFRPSREADLLAWSTNFNAKINATPTAYGLTAIQATAYTSLHAAFAAAFAAATNPNTNSKQTVAAKNQAKQALLTARNGAKELVGVAQAFPSITNAQRAELGLRIPSTGPSPIPAPTSAPEFAVVSTFGRTVKIRLRDAENPDRRGKPDGTEGATILMYVGEAAPDTSNVGTVPPSDPSSWVFLVNTSKTIVDLDIPANVAAGTKLWLTAFWFNARKQAGPAATPQSARINDGLAQAA